MSHNDPKAVIELTGEDLFKGHAPSGHAVMIDADRTRNSAASPMELLLLGLGSCTGVDVVSILRKKREEVTGYRVEVRAQRRDEHPRSYKRMEVHHIVTGRNVSERSVAQAIDLSEQKYCSVAATLRPTAEIVSSFEIIEPYGTITISGWQMSSERARRFYFTSERDSYGAKLGQTANLGVISAVFFRERRSIPVTVTPPPRPRPLYEEDSRGREEMKSKSPSTSAGEGTADSSARRPNSQPVPDDEYAATGIGRSVHHDVRWVNLDLESRPSAEVTIRYEYYPALVRLGILPRPYYRPDTLRRREGSTGFEDRRYSPEP